MVPTETQKAVHQLQGAAGTDTTTEAGRGSKERNGMSGCLSNTESPIQCDTHSFISPLYLSR